MVPIMRLLGPSLLGLLLLGCSGIGEVISDTVTPERKSQNTVPEFSSTPMQSLNPTESPFDSRTAPIVSPTLTPEPLTLATGASCPISRSNVVKSPSEHYVSTSDYQNAEGTLYVGHYEGKIVAGGPDGGAGIMPDGSIGVKVGWYRVARGDLFIEGHRLDAPAPPLRSGIPAGYGSKGFQATALFFPTEGCWEVTGRVGVSNVTFVVMVVKEGDLPIPTEKPRDTAIKSEIKRYDLYPIPASCAITPLRGREGRGWFAGWWWDGMDGNRFGAVTPTGVLFEGLNVIRWKSRVPNELSIHGEKLAGEEIPLEVEEVHLIDIPENIPESEGQLVSTSIIFENSGCWRMQAESGEFSLEAIVYVYPYSCRPPALLEENAPETSTPCKPHD